MSPSDPNQETHKTVPKIIKTKPVKRAILVYQAGLANVFEVKTISEVSARRGEAKRLMQHNFRLCEFFARGLEAAGCEVASMECNMPGDISSQTWRSYLTDAPFARDMCPVGQYDHD